VGAVRRAALLHDLGKLALPVSILDQQGPLSPEQWESVRRQPYYTHRILSRVRGVGPLADDASSHHERIDGRGYFRGLSGDRIPLTGRIIAVADSFQALTSDRPFRGALPEETALRLLARDRGIGIDPDCHAALVDTLEYTGIEPLERAA
jgi:HD-GYP domain-containing protein (c-di-GMP phosphodiesterase class II)